MARQMKDSGVEWIGEIPEEWKVERTKYFYSTHKNIAGSESSAYERLALTMKGVVKRSKIDNTGLQPDNFDTYQILYEGELVFKLIDLQNISTSRVGLSPYTGLVSPAYIILKPHKNVVPEFGQYYFLSMWHREIFNHLGDDGVRSSLNSHDLLGVPYPILCCYEQHRIADYLDAKCAEIDKVVEKTRGTIEEYKKLKQSIITETVTKGLNPDAEMKDSGIPWIGKIPVDWKIRKVKLCYSIISGSGFADSLQGKESGELPVCKASDISNAGHNLNSAANYLSRAEASVNGFSIIPIGSVLFPKIGEAMRKNSRTISRVPCCLDNNCQAAVPQNIDTEYGYYVLFSVDMTWFDNNGTVPCINNSKFKNAFLPIPPPLEQHRIADYLDAKCAEIDNIIEKKEQLIEELGSYKKSLIYEYVTGKKEVQA